MSLLQMSLSGGVLILLITVVRGVAIHRLPKNTFLVLWDITALRLLLPISIALPVNTAVGIDHWADTIQNEAIGHFADLPAGQISSVQGSGASIPAQSARPISVFTVIWLAGVILLAFWFAVSYTRSVRKFKMALPDHSPFVQEWLTAHRICRPLEVRRLDRISSPLTYGVLRPVILLPRNWERSDEAVLTYVLTHEYIHIRRFDNVMKVIFAAALCVHWFNPLVWVMYILVNRDMELSCDDKVIRMLGEKQKSAYALALISMEEMKCGASPLYSHFSKLAMKERIEAIMKYRKASALAIVFALLLAVGAATAFAAAAETGVGQGGLDLEGLTGAIHDDWDRMAEATVDPEGAGDRADFQTPETEGQGAPSDAGTVISSGQEGLNPEGVGNHTDLPNGKEPQTGTPSEVNAAIPSVPENMEPGEVGNHTDLPNGKEPQTGTPSEADAVIPPGKESINSEGTGDSADFQTEETGVQEARKDSLPEGDIVMLYPHISIMGSNAWRSTAFTATPANGNYIQFSFQNDISEKVRVYLCRSNSETVVETMSVAGNSQGSKIYCDSTGSGTYYILIEAIDSGGLIDGEIFVAQSITNP